MHRSCEGLRVLHCAGQLGVWPEGRVCYCATLRPSSRWVRSVVSLVGTAHGYVAIHVSEAKARFAWHGMLRVGVSMAEGIVAIYLSGRGLRSYGSRGSASSRACSLTPRIEGERRIDSPQPQPRFAKLPDTHRVSRISPKDRLRGLRSEYLGGGGARQLGRTRLSPCVLPVARPLCPLDPAGGFAASAVRCGARARSACWRVDLQR